MFGVSPGLTPELVAGGAKWPAFAARRDDAVGCHRCTRRRIHRVKLFPAQQAGGIGMLKAMGGPFPDVTFCPTGGITAETAADFLALPNVACVGGSWLTPPEAVAAGDWERITSLARDAARLHRPAS